MTFLSAAISISETTSSTCERPFASQRIKLLAPGALPSTTISVGDAAMVSTTVGLLESTRVNGFCTLMRIDLPTSTCTVSPSAGATGCDVSWPTAILPIKKTSNAILAKLELIIWSPVPSGLHQIYELYVAFLE